MDAVQATLAGRHAAEQMMGDQCTITRNAGGYTTDPNTGQVVPNVATIYEGKCKVQATGPSASTPASGGFSYTIQSYSLHIPATAAPAKVDDVVTITAAPLDPARVGTSARVTETFQKTYQTAQRLTVEITT